MKHYDNTDKHIHQLSQTLAKFNRTFVPKKEDDSHTNISFDFIGEKLWSHAAKLNGEFHFLTYNFHHQCFELTAQNYKIIKSFATIGKYFSVVESDIANYLNENFQTNDKTFTSAMHFEIPEYNFVNQKIKKLGDESISQWMHSRHQANVACQSLTTHLNKTASIRIWTHHFDTGIYVEFTKTLGIGFGLAMADSMVEEAYYYLSAYGLNGNRIEYEKVEKLAIGEWITGENWNGAVLKLSDATDKNITTYLNQSINWMLTQL